MGWSPRLWWRRGLCTQVLATSRSPYEAAAASLGAAFYRDANDFCEEHPDVVVLATSILSTEGVLAGLPVQRLRRNTLFVDVLSVKLFPKRLMLALLPPEVRPGARTVRRAAQSPPALARSWRRCQRCMQTRSQHDSSVM